MKLIDKGFDSVLGSNFELCVSTYSELKKLAMSWYHKNIAETGEKARK